VAVALITDMTMRTAREQGRRAEFCFSARLLDEYPDVVYALLREVLLWRIERIHDPPAFIAAGWSPLFEPVPADTLASRIPIHTHLLRVRTTLPNGASREEVRLVRLTFGKAGTLEQTFVTDVKE
jgi:hypothetical protein